jgi:hypothetical protein
MNLRNIKWRLQQQSKLSVCCFYCPVLDIAHVRYRKEVPPPTTPAVVSAKPVMNISTNKEMEFHLPVSVSVSAAAVKKKTPSEPLRNKEQTKKGDSSNKRKVQGQSTVKVREREGEGLLCR